MRPPPPSRRGCACRRAAPGEVGRQEREEAEGLEDVGAEAGEVVDGSFGDGGVERVR